jgi:hypothetical protein
VLLGQDNCIPSNIILPDQYKQKYKKPLIKVTVGRLDLPQLVELTESLGKRVRSARRALQRSERRVRRNRIMDYILACGKLEDIAFQIFKSNGHSCWFININFQNKLSVFREMYKGTFFV